MPYLILNYPIVTCNADVTDALSQAHFVSLSLLQQQRQQPSWKSEQDWHLVEGQLTAALLRWVCSPSSCFIFALFPSKRQSISPGVFSADMPQKNIRVVAPCSKSCSIWLHLGTRLLSVRMLRSGLPGVGQKRMLGEEWMLKKEGRPFINLSRQHSVRLHDGIIRILL